MVGDLTISLINVPSPGASQFCQMPFSPPLCRVGERKGRIDIVVKIQHLDYTLDNSTDVNVPTPWIKFFYVTTPSKDAIYPQLGEVGHIVDSGISASIKNCA